MHRSERLTLAAHVQAARIRAKQARERHATGLRFSAMVSEAFERFEAQHGRPMDPKSPGDSPLFLEHLEATGAARLTRDQVLAARDADVECRERDGAVVQALDALCDAWGPEGRGNERLLAWVGCSSDEFRAAVQAALPDVSLDLWDIVDDARN